MWDASILIQKSKINRTSGFLLPSIIPSLSIHSTYFIKCQHVNSSHIGTSINHKRNITVWHHWVQNICRAVWKWQKEFEAMVISSGKHVLDREGRKSWGCCQPLAPCCSSFWSCFSSFEMFTWCIIRNWPFKWKTGMSNLYLSYQAEFSGSVMSTSCKTNWNRDRLKLYFSATWNNAMVIVTNWSPDQF